MRNLLSRAGVLLALSGPNAGCFGFSYLSITSRLSLPSEIVLFGKLARSNEDAAAISDALDLLNEAKALRAQASALQLQLDQEKEERIRRQREKVDSLIDALLFHGVNDNNDNSAQPTGDEQKRSKQLLINTEEKVASLLLSKRMNYEMVIQMFDRICKQPNRPQSIDSCSPLLSLLLDAACQVDCLEREDNPNKRWNGRVERDLRRKLFALGYGIRIEDVEKENNIRSITGEKDYF